MNASVSFAASGGINCENPWNNRARLHRISFHLNPDAAFRNAQGYG